MQSFNFISPTKVLFGKHKVEEIGKELKQLGSAVILVVYGMNSVVKSGLLDKVLSLLKDQGFKVLCFGGIRSNPEISKVREGVKIAKENYVDTVLAIGGGSVIDAAKSIAASVSYSGDPFDFNLYKAVPSKVLPIAVILTISAAGSELSSSCVIQDDNTGMKKGFNSDLVRPQIAIEDPSLTFSVSPYQTAVGIVDILMHTLERYFSTSASYELADEFAIGLLKTVIKAGRTAIAHPDDYTARANLMLASSYSHNGITSIGKAYKMPCHALEHILSGLYPEIAHGAGLAVIFPAWAKEYQNEECKKMAVLAKELFACRFSSIKDGAIMFVQSIEKYFKELQMPLTFGDLGIQNVDINKLLEQFVKNGTRAVDHRSKPLDVNVAKSIYERCN